MHRIIWPILLLLLASTVRAQEPATQQITDQTPVIQDNSFLIEEAYNQEAGVVQHINTFMRQHNGDVVYTFTQEWPLFSQKHQFSYTIPVQHIESSPDGGTGLGDIALNYRYQLLGNGEAQVACSPRFTLLVPTGDEHKELGAGALGIQVNVPVSVVLSKVFVTHFNVGTTYTPFAKNARGDRADLHDYNLGSSIIWLAHPRFNVLLETVWNSRQSVVGPGMKERDQSVFISPGVRWAYNLPSGLQIVPGIAVPIGVGPSHGEHSLFVYLSFEHPFKKQQK
jgi:hypothetical protein